MGVGGTLEILLGCYYDSASNLTTCTLYYRIPPPYNWLSKLTFNLATFSGYHSTISFTLFVTLGWNVNVFYTYVWGKWVIMEDIMSESSSSSHVTSFAAKIEHPYSGLYIVDPQLTAEVLNGSVYVPAFSTVTVSKTQTVEKTVTPSYVQTMPSVISASTLFLAVALLLASLLKMQVQQSE